jgi:hypothetical protein
MGRDTGSLDGSPVAPGTGGQARTSRIRLQSPAAARANERAVAAGATMGGRVAPSAADDQASPGPDLGWLQTARAGRSRWTNELKLPRRVPAAGRLPELPDSAGMLALALLRRPIAAVGVLTFEVIAIVLVTRLFLAGVSWLSLRAVERLDRYPRQLPDTIFPSHAALDGWARWDAAHYVAIATHGYQSANPSPGDGAGFFPLYPALMRIAVEAVGQSPTRAAVAVAGLVIANLAFLVAAPLLANLTATRFGESAGRNAALVLCLSPFSFFFSAVYSESLFLLLALVALTFAQRRRWAWAAIAAGLASGTRLAGLALTPALLVQARRNQADREDLALIGLMAPGGAVLYFFYGSFAFGDPFAYLKAQATWGGWGDHVGYYVSLFITRPAEALGGDPRHLIILLNLAIAAVAVALLPRVWRQLDPAVAVFTVLIVVGHILVTWVSLGRYLLPAVGLYMVGGALLSQPRLAGWPRDLFLAGSALVLAVLTVLFAHGFWVV